MRVHVGNTRVRASWLGAVVGTIGGLAYSSFLLEGFFRTGLNPLHSYVSESSVAGRPYAFLFRTGDIAAGCGLLVLAMALARRLPARCPRAGRCLALAVTTAASITDGVWPMPCAPSVDPVCRAADSADLGQQLRQVHTLSSLTEFTGVILAMLLLSTVLHRTGHRRLARWSLVAGILAAALGALEIAMVLTGVRWVGLPERAQVLLVSAWCTAMARFLVHAPPASAPPARCGGRGHAGRLPDAHRALAASRRPPASQKPTSSACAGLHPTPRAAPTAVLLRGSGTGVQVPDPLLLFLCESAQVE
ncbi:DUF998 domain-containing protein [Streptomyces monashensis]|uniref:DUF998 domain-containing protein n=1 Tax=Streptomyces monashensis TaxID=1678012 RepID=UPI00116057C7|nr:DUF998 domain-containing protein [Streptomyces monashensis]